MDSDRELLAWATKAAGLTIARWVDNVPQLVSDTHQLGNMWNPLHSGLDALDLACTLYMTVKIDDGMFTLVDAENWQRGIFIDAVIELHKNTTPLQATCRAIVRAAAEIGKAMNEPKPD